MAPYVRKVQTPSGATAVQIVSKRYGVRTIDEHVGSGRNPAEVEALVHVAKKKIHGGQQTFDLDALTPSTPIGAEPYVVANQARVLWEQLCASYDRVGLDSVGNDVFKQLTLGRVVKATSKAGTLEVLKRLGIPTPSLRTVWRVIGRCATEDWRETVSKATYAHANNRGPLRLVLYDVTTLYFEIDEEDDLRKVGLSKERRVDPQIVVGLLTTRDGFPLEIQCFEGNKAETTTLVPVLEAFRSRNTDTDMVVVGDAGMLSAGNLNALEDAGFAFIVGSRITQAPYDLAEHFTANDTTFVDGQTIECSRLMGLGENRRSRRVVYQYREKRARRDALTLSKEIERAESIVSGRKPPKKARFVKTKGDAKPEIDQKRIDTAGGLIGLKGYVTNIPEIRMGALEVAATYHDLFQIERSFRMAKSDLRARPIFHHQRGSIEAHLTIVFAALAVGKDLEERSGISIKKLVETLEPLRTMTININGHTITANTPASADAEAILTCLKTGH